MKIGEFVKKIEAWLPAKVAENWDNVGLLLGDYEQELKKVVVALDVDEEAIKKAVAIKADLILAHHPLIFTPLKSLTSKDLLWEKINSLLQHKIAVYAAHTNLDKAKDGVNQRLAEMLQLTDVAVLQPEKNIYKLVVFVPEANLNELREALGSAGAGVIGAYRYCSFNTPGTGAFLPEAGAKPAIGQVGRLEEVAERRLEVLVGEERLNQVIAAMLKVHPYEEVAYDLYSLAGVNREFGLGKVGYLKQPLNEEEFLSYCQERLKVKLKVAGHKDFIKKVAVCGGSGGRFIELAAKAGADAFISGDFSYHHAQLATSLNLLLVDAGHQGTEVAAVDCLSNWVKRNIPELEVTTLQPVTLWR